VRRVLDVVTERTGAVAGSTDHTRATDALGSAHRNRHQAHPRPSEPAHGATRERPNVTVHVLLFEAGVHRSMSGSFTARTTPERPPTTGTSTVRPFSVSQRSHMTAVSGPRAGSVAKYPQVRLRSQAGQLHRPCTNMVLRLVTKPGPGVG
jgi:hypothetical protein